MQRMPRRWGRRRAEMRGGSRSQISSPRFRRRPMVEIFHSDDSSPFSQIEQLRKGSWINLLAPTDMEINEISRILEIELDFLKDPLDSEERSRLETDENQILLIIDIPIVEFPNEEDKSEFVITTLPLGMILLPDYFITICLKRTPILEEFKMGRVKQFTTARSHTFMLHLLQKTATYYLRYLRHINRKNNEYEMKLHRSTKNAELFELLGLEKTLVYFTTSLRSNQNILRKLRRVKQLGWSEDDEELFEDVMIEIDQAIEMTQTYSSILSGLMDAFASVVSNNLNIVMKLLTSITIVLSIPTMVSSFFGMNVPGPWQTHPYAFLTILLSTAVLVGASVALLYRKNLF
jgi:magnesium transporter